MAIVTNMSYAKVCIKDFNRLHRQEAYRKAVQESRGALEEEEDDASKADNKEQVVKIIVMMIRTIFMMVVIHCLFPGQSFKLA